MFGSETFIARVAEDDLAPRVGMGDYVRVDPDDPAAHGRLVAVRDPGRAGETVFKHRFHDRVQRMGSLDGGARKSPAPTRVPEALMVSRSNR